jgi:hypothetical protein
MTLGGYLWLPEPARPVAIVPAAKVPAAPQNTGTPSLRQSAEDARQAVASLTERLADESKEQARWLWSTARPLDISPMVSLPSVEELEQPFDPAAKSLRHTGAAVSEGIQTVAQSAGKAIAYFVRELPPMEPVAKN